MVTGWRKLADPRLTAWAKAALGPAQIALQDAPRRAGGTWAVGLDLLPNDPSGAIGGVDLPWDLLGLPKMPLHPAQLSVIYPDYPRQDPEQSDAAFRFMTRRDSAHLDGLLPEGPDKRRFLREPHAYILGLPLTATASAPLVVWEGSHTILQAAFSQVSGDLTDVYSAARAKVFDTCKRVEVVAEVGEAVILHRALIHGVSPWKGGDQPRIIAYFRPLLPSVADWLLP
jgi:hypothetical protein